MARTATALGGAVVAALVLAACAESGTTVTGVADTAASLTITVAGQVGTPAGAPLELDVGETAALAATATNALGLAVSGVAAAWSSSAPSVVQVDPSGGVLALAAGSADVIAAVPGAAAAIRVVVSDTTTVSPAP